MNKKSGYIYFMIPEDLPGCVKVDRAKDPEIRAKELSTQHKTSYTVVKRFQSYDYVSDEKHILKALRARGHKPIRGSECFEIEITYLESIISTCIEQGTVGTLAGPDSLNGETLPPASERDMHSDGYKRFGCILRRVRNLFLFGNYRIYPNVVEKINDQKYGLVQSVMPRIQ